MVMSVFYSAAETLLMMDKVDMTLGRFSATRFFLYDEWRLCSVQESL